MNIPLEYYVEGQKIDFGNQGHESKTPGGPDGRLIVQFVFDFDKSKFTYDFRFTLYTDDLMDLNNRINIKGIYNAKPEEFQKNTVIESGNAHGYLNNNTYAKIYILA